MTERLDRNDESRNRADHNREEWSVDEVEFLMLEFPPACGKPAEENALAEILGRTIEACRQRFYVARRGEGKVVSYKETITSTVTTRETYIGLYDDPEDRWWDSGSNSNTTTN